jgi:ribA/ribD-fused uncharacterized protein
MLNDDEIFFFFNFYCFFSPHSAYSVFFKKKQKNKMNSDNKTTVDDEKKQKQKQKQRRKRKQRQKQKRDHEGNEKKKRIKQESRQVEETPLFFWGHNSMLSNWNRVEFCFENKYYTSAEQAYLATKANYFGDEEHAKLIRESRDANLQKEFGRTVRNYDSKAWHAVSKTKMTEILMCKFKQSVFHKHCLLSTGSRVLAESSPDKRWGTGFEIDSQQSLDPSKWTGQNWLGKCLMEVRSKLRRSEPDIRQFFGKIQKQ